MEGSSCPTRKKPDTGSNNGVKQLCPRKRLRNARITFGENHQRSENDKEQNPRRTTTASRQGNQRCKTRTANTHRAETGYLGPTRTNNLGHYATPTAKPRHNMGRAQHCQVQTCERVSRTLHHSGPDKGIGAKRWSGSSTSTGAPATNNTSRPRRGVSCGTNNVARS